MRETAGMFKKLLAAVGFGSAEVETQLHTPGVQPGGTIQGVVRLRGGEVEQEIPGLSVELVVRVEHEGGDEEVDMMRGVHRVELARDVELRPEQVVEWPFALPTPPETPITHYRDHPLHGAEVAVRTRLDVSGGIDATDLDPVGIGALPAQHMLLEAVERLGFRLHRADCEAGNLRGTRQSLQFYQEIEFLGSPNYPRLNQLEVTFVADMHGMDVVLETDKKSGMVSEGRDLINILRVDYGTMQRVDWAAELHRLLGAMNGG